MNLSGQDNNHVARIMLVLVLVFLSVLSFEASSAQTNSTADSMLQTRTTYHTIIDAAVLRHRS